MSTPQVPDRNLAELLRLEVFAPLRGSAFRVQRGPVPVELRLEEAVARSGHRPVEAESFSLLFTGGPDLPLVQGAHAFEHPDLGRFELFITPVIYRRNDLRAYEAVINRLAAL